MKKISLKGLNQVLSEKELKNVMGGSEWPNPEFECTIAYGNGYVRKIGCGIYGASYEWCLDMMRFISSGHDVCGFECHKA